jgi:hypothetical protein
VTEELAPHVAFDHLQGRFGQVPMDVGHRVTGDGDLEMAHVGIEGAVQDALLGHLSGQQHPLDAGLPEQVLERSRVEGAVAGLDDQGITGSGSSGSTSSG